VNQDTLSVDGDKLVVKADGNYIYYTVANNANYAENDYAYVKTAEKTYYVNSDVIYAAEKTAVDEILARKNEDGTAVFNTVDEACKRYLIEQAQVAVEVAYEEEISEKTKFLWIKNIWATDAVYKHPVLNHTDFKTGAQSEDFEINGKKADFNDLPLVYHETAYNEITANLAKEKAEPNGFFILIALSIGTILLQQWITMRSQKEQQKRIDAWHNYWNEERLAKVRQLISKTATQAGLNADAFSTFFEAATRDYKPDKLYEVGLIPQGYQSTLMEQSYDGNYLCFTSVRCQNDSVRSAESDYIRICDAIASDPNLLVLDTYYYTTDTLLQMSSDFDVLQWLSMLFVFVVLLLSFHFNIKHTVLGFMPILLSWLIVLGAMVIADVRFNLISIII
jgi:hypothetical protein